MVVLLHFCQKEKSVHVGQAQIHKCAIECLLLDNAKGFLSCTGKPALLVFQTQQTFL